MDLELIIFLLISIDVFMYGFSDIEGIHVTFLFLNLSDPTPPQFSN